MTFTYNLSYDIIIILRFGGMELEILIKRKELSSKLSLASRFIASGRATMPITKGVLLTASDESGAFFIDASDFKHSCKLKIDKDNLKIKEEGEVVVNGDELIKLVNSFKGEELRLKVSSGRLKITQLNNDDITEFNMATFVDGPEKFPTMPLPSDEATKYEVDRDNFLSVLRKVSFAAEKNESIRDNEAGTFSTMMFLTEDMAYATNKQKFAAIMNPDTVVREFSIPKGATSYFRDLSDKFIMYVEGDIFYVQDGDYFFMVKVPITNPPTKQIKQLLNNPEDPVVEYELEKDDISEFIDSLKQMKILNEYVTLYLKEDSIWLSGVNYEESASNSLHNSVKAIRLKPETFEKEILISFKTKYLLQVLRKVSQCRVVFGGGYQDRAPTRFYEGNFQTVIQRMVAKNEEQVLDRIKDFQDNI